MNDILERYCAIVPGLRAAWDEERSGRDDCTVYTMFRLLTAELRVCVERGETERLPRLFAEVERSMETGSSDEGNAAATCFLENISNGSPELYPLILPFVGERSLSFLLAWESQAGDRTSFVRADEAEGLAIGALAAACPAFRDHWAHGGRSVSASDGTTTSFSIASSALTLVLRLLSEGDIASASNLLSTVDRLLATSARRFDDAFRESFLDRLERLPWSEVRRVRGVLGTIAGDYWDRELRFGVVRVGAVREGRFVETRAIERTEDWAVDFRLPIPEASAHVHVIVRHGEHVSAEAHGALDESGRYRAVWGWSADDPDGDYALELAWSHADGTPGATCPALAFTLGAAAPADPQ